MSSLVSDAVAVVVDPSYGEQLATLSTEMPVWIADTVPNRTVAEQCWADRFVRNEVTTFVVQPNGSPETWLLGVLATVEIHHGEEAHGVPYTRLLVVGTPATGVVRSALASFGFSVVEEGEGSFRAQRRTGSSHGLGAG